MTIFEVLEKREDAAMLARTERAATLYSALHSEVEKLMVRASTLEDLLDRLLAAEEAGLTDEEINALNTAYMQTPTVPQSYLSSYGTTFISGGTINADSIRANSINLSAHHG